MMRLVASLIALNYILGVVIARAVPEEEEHDYLDVEAYHWRDYKGLIPRDALPGGLNCNHTVTYIGQVLHKDQLIPAKIEPLEKKAYYEWGYKEFSTSKNIKIFCTEHPEAFEWIKTGNKDINGLAKKHHVVEGGYEDGVTILIGRKQLEDELAIGKVVFTDDQSTLNIPKDGVGVQHAAFEVLTYNPEAVVEKYKKSQENTSVAVVEDKEKHAEESHDAKEVACKEGSVVVNIYHK